MEDLVFKRMSNIAKRYIKHYKTDFTNYDIPQYQDAMNGMEYVWIVRPYGTYLLSLPKQLPMIGGPYTEEQLARHRDYRLDICRYYGDGENRFYHVIKGKSIKKVSKQFCLDLLSE